MAELKRVFRNSLKFYLERIKLIVLFSIPFLVSFSLLMLVSAPTYLAIGGVYSRTGSLPDLSTTDIALIAAAYILSFFLIADTITNVNLIVKEKRTRNINSREVISAMGTYATRIFYIYTIMLLLIFVAQLLLFENSFRTWIYPIFTLALSFLLFFVVPAVVIDNESTADAISKSANMALRKPVFIFAWAISGLILLSVPKIIADFTLPHSISPYILLLLNSLFVLPFMIVLQTQMYMEKYPLAR